MMKTIPGTSVTPIEECCGHDGTWAMKTEFFQLSLKAGKKAFDGMQAAEAAETTTDCPLAAIQFEQATGRRPIHPLQVLSKAYKAPGEGGFATPVPRPEEE